MMSRAQLTKQEKASYLLPDDCHYETNNLFKTFLRLSVLVRRQSTQKHQSQDKEGTVHMHTQLPFTPCLYIVLYLVDFR